MSGKPQPERDEVGLLSTNQGPLLVEGRPRTTAGPVAPVALELSRGELRQLFSSHPLNNLVVISKHAIDRYRKRFRDELEIEDARYEVYAAMRTRGQFTPIPPEWLFQVARSKSVAKMSIGFIVIDDEIALPLRVNTPHRKSTDQQEQPYVAVTCLYRLGR